MRSTVAILLLMVPLVAAQEDQRPRPPVKDTHGLLKIDPIYFDLAAKTGGDFYFWAPEEFATSRLEVPIHREDVVLSYGTLEGKRRFEIPVESGVRELTLFAGIQRKDLAVLVRPDGTVARDSDGIALQVFQHMLIAKVRAPAAGIWRLEIDGAGTYAVTAHVQAADDAPGFDGFEFADGRCRVTMSGTLREPEIAFVAMDGSLIATAPPDGPCTLPTPSFRAMLRGIDSRGARFQRIESQLRAR